MRLLVALFTLLTGCGGSRKSEPAAPPTRPGTSIPLAYPILCLKKIDAPNMWVFKSELDFTTTTYASGFDYTPLQIIDSSGGLYTVKSAAAYGERVSPWSRMGNTPYRVFLDLKPEKPTNLEAARKIVLEIVRLPRSYWEGSPDSVSKAVEWVQSYRTLDELIAGCAEYWSWR